jgi:ParB-like chromosome segregation protein Spo0J
MARVENLSVEYLPVDSITGYARNSRTHSDEQVGQIAASIKEFGFVNPILIDEEKTIIAGHGRLAAAHKLKLEEVPTITLAGLTEAQRRAAPTSSPTTASRLTPGGICRCSPSRSAT